jgi:hypothetical protein
METEKPLSNNNKDAQPKVIEWDFKVPLYNRFIVLDFFKVLIIPVCLILIIIIWNEYSLRKKGFITNTSDYKYAIIFFGIFVLLSIFLLWLIYRNRFESHFKLSQKEASVSYGGTTKRKNAFVNTLLIIFGITSHRPGAAGTGLISASRQTVSVNWNNVFKVVLFPRNNVIVLRNSWRQVMVLYCTNDNYKEVAKFATSKVEARGEQIKKDTVKIKKERIFIAICVPIAIFFGLLLGGLYKYSWENPALVFIMIALMVLTIILPWRMRKFMAKITLTCTILLLIYGLFVFFADNFYFDYDGGRLIAFLSGIAGMIAINIFLIKRKEE